MIVLQTKMIVNLRLSALSEKYIVLMTPVLILMNNVLNKPLSVNQTNTDVQTSLAEINMKIV